MTTKHTPGPWALPPLPNEGTPDITVLAHVQTKGPHSKPGLTIPMYIARVYGTGEHLGPVNQERLANARLIASAPELLDVLKRLLSFNPSPHDDMNHNDFVEAVIAGERAIAKAEGR